VTAPAGSGSGREEPRAAAPADPLRVLVVEDSDDDVLLILRHLRRGGFETAHRKVRTREEMTRALEEGGWDLVISDYRIPGFDADRALEVVKASGRKLPFLIVSGAVGEEAAAESLRAGAHDFLLKENLARLPHVVARELREAEHRRRRQEAERRSALAEARYRALFEQSRDGIAVTTRDGRFLEGNAAILRMLRVSRQELSTLNARDLYVDPEERVRLIRRLEGGEEIVDHSVELRRSDGSTFHALLSTIPWQGGRGEGEGQISIVRDRSDEVRARKRLEESEKRFRQIAERIDDAFWMTTPDKSEMLYVSPAYEEIWGRNREELYENPGTWLEAVHPDDRERLREAIPRQIAGDYDEEFRIVRPDGEVRWVRDRAFPIRNEGGEVHRIVGVAKDITEERKAQEARRRAEERYRALVENSGDVIGILGPDFTTRYVTPSMRRVLGYEPEEIVNTRGVSRLHPDDREWVVAELEELQERPGDTVVQNHRLIAKDGSVRHVESIATNLLHLPSVRGIVINLRDVTEQKELEEQLRQSQKMEAIGRLAGGVAHDFNNLLTVIEGRADFALDGLGDDSPLREDLHEILGAAERAASLTRQLLAFSKHQILQPTTLDLNRVVGEMEQMFGRIIGEDVELRVDLDGEPLGVEADPAQLQQVLLNLVVNAREAMPEGGRLTIRTGCVASVSELETQEGWHGSRELGRGPLCWLQVRDTGEGIAEEIRDRIFDPFFTTKAEGTGLGLSTVHGIVEQSGGAMAVESAPGEETTITVLFPRVDLPGEEERPAPSSRAELDAGETVLVVEDDDAIRSVVVRTLRKFGYDVVAARDAPHALELANQTLPPPGLLLTDVVMPGIDGPELARTLSERFPDLRVLFMSGYSGDVVWDERRPAEEIDFLAKPFLPEELVRKVREVLEG